MKCVLYGKYKLNQSKETDRWTVFFQTVTVRVFLVGVDDESAVVVVVEDAVVVVVVVTVVSEAVVVGVQLGAVGDVGTVVSAVLVAVSVPAGRRDAQVFVFDLILPYRLSAFTFPVR